MGIGRIRSPTVNAVIPRNIAVVIAAEDAALERAVRTHLGGSEELAVDAGVAGAVGGEGSAARRRDEVAPRPAAADAEASAAAPRHRHCRSEEHTSELQSRPHLV